MEKVAKGCRWITLATGAVCVIIAIVFTALYGGMKNELDGKVCIALRDNGVGIASDAER